MIRRIIVALLVALVTALANTATAAPAAHVAPAVAPSASTTTHVQSMLKGFGYTVAIDGIYGPQTERAVRHFQKSNHLLADGIAGPITIARMESAVAPVASAPAVRLNPPAPSFSSDCDEMSFYRQAAGLPDQFDAIGFRESRCQNTAANACCFGWWQNYISSHLSRASAYRDRIINECGVTSVNDMLGNSVEQKKASACVTFVVWSISGMSPWSL